MLFTRETLLSDLSNDKKTNWRLNEEIIAHTLSRQPRYKKPHLIPLIDNHGYYDEGEKETGGIRLEKELENTTWGEIHQGYKSRIVKCNVCHEINHCLRSFVPAFCPESPKNILCLHTGIAGVYPMLEIAIRILVGRDILDVEESAKMIAILRCYGKMSLALDRAIAREECPDHIVGRLIANPHVHKDLLAVRGQEALGPISGAIIANTRKFINTGIERGVGKDVPYMTGFNTPMNQLCLLTIQKAMELIPEIPQLEGRYIDYL